jgi:hypothetical protein
MMEEKKVNQKEFSTCLEGLSCAEMMKKMKGQQGMGSLCEEMMRSMMSKCRGSKEEPKETKAEDSHDRGK